MQCELFLYFDLHTVYLAQTKEKGMNIYKIKLLHQVDTNGRRGEGKYTDARGEKFIAQKNIFECREFTPT